MRSMKKRLIIFLMVAAMLSSLLLPMVSMAVVNVETRDRLSLFLNLDN
jgi:hypothetical protein